MARNSRERAGEIFSSINFRLPLEKKEAIEVLASEGGYLNTSEFLIDLLDGVIEENKTVIEEVIARRSKNKVTIRDTLKNVATPPPDTSKAKK